MAQLRGDLLLEDGRSMLRHIRVANKAELGDRIRHYIETHNASPVVPNWRCGLNRDQASLAA
jgi:hypothetical protein